LRFPGSIPTPQLFTVTTQVASRLT
jgi:hypothetical protein